MARPTPMPTTKHHAPIGVLCEVKSKIRIPIILESEIFPCHMTSGDAWSVAATLFGADGGKKING